jgi:hypothetical protein
MINGCEGLQRLRTEVALLEGLKAVEVGITKPGLGRDRLLFDVQFVEQFIYSLFASAE